MKQEGDLLIPVEHATPSLLPKTALHQTKRIHGSQT